MDSLKMKSLATPEFLYLAFVTLGQDIGLHWKDFQTLSTRFRNEGLPFLTKTLPTLAKAMLAGIGSGVFQLPSNFKKKSARSALPAFLGSHFAKVFSFNGTLRPDADPVAILMIRQFCEFAYKANLPRNEADDQKVVDRFVAVEAELASLVIPPDPILRVANGIMHGLFADFDAQNINCKHGPGVTANVSILEKYDHTLTASLSSVSHFGSTFFFNETDGIVRETRYPVWSHRDYFRDASCAKVILVPKDSRGPRLISCEPAENQWVQQGIARYMVEKLETDPISAGSVNFTSQEVNRNLVLEHSVSREFSTLDLKDASDRVSLQLVDRLFDGLELLDALHLVRSNRTQVPRSNRLILDLGRFWNQRLMVLVIVCAYLEAYIKRLLGADTHFELSLRKHAPMGSALCFPVMAVSIYSILIAGLIGRGLSFSEAKGSVYIYGDDIVIRTEYATYAIALLERYGLRVNKDKCFIDSLFLESCGMDAFNGNIVTPVRLRECEVCPNVLREKPKILVSLLETANLLAESGYGRTSQMLYSYCEAWLGPLPYGHVDSPYLHRRAIGPAQRRVIPEMNALKPGLRWKVDPRRDYNPLGRLLRAWFVKTKEETHEKTTRYGHLMRIWGQIGTGRDTLPQMGVFTLPRQFVLAQKYFDHYAIMALPE